MECPSFYFTGFLHYINLFPIIHGLFFLCYVFFLYSFLQVLLIQVLKFALIWIQIRAPFWIRYVNNFDKNV